MEVLLYSILATMAVSIISFIGIFALALNEKFLNSITKTLIAFAAGGMLGGAFFHLIPELITDGEQFIFPLVVAGFVLFFILERVLFWRHCHEGNCHIHEFTYLNLVGDAIHNFLDGLIISASFMANFAIGITTTIAVIMHEIPQELGDFAVLIYGGFSKNKAMFFNFLSAMTAIIGAVVGYLIGSSIEGFMPVMVAIAAGGFIYIGASDLIPELHHETDFKKSIICLFAFIFGLALMWLLTLIG